MLDTEGVIVSPSADLPFNGGLSVGSHAKACAALFYLKGYSAVWPKCFTAALKHKNIVQFSILLGLLKPRLKRPYRKSRGVCNANMWVCTCKPLCEFSFFLSFFLFFLGLVARH